MDTVWRQTGIAVFLVLAVTAIIIAIAQVISAQEDGNDEQDEKHSCWDHWLCDQHTAVPTQPPPTTPPTGVPFCDRFPLHESCLSATHPPTAVPPTAVPPTAVPPTAVPPTAVPPTPIPPTQRPAATNTPRPPITVAPAPTNTPRPPITIAPRPTNTPRPGGGGANPTNTPRPPTATPTVTTVAPTPTATPVSVGPTSTHTPTPRPTSTSAPAPAQTPRPTPVRPNPVPVPLPSMLNSFPDCDAMLGDDWETRSVDDPGGSGPTFAVELGPYIIADGCI